jgi:hypothetical protein
MATKSIIFFTAGPVATSDELTAIGKLEAATEQPYSVKVFNGLRSPNYGYGIEQCDYVAGTIPTAYDAFDVIDPDAIPGAGGNVEDGQNTLVRDISGTQVTGTCVVDDGALTRVETGLNYRILHEGDGLALKTFQGVDIKTLELSGFDATPVTAELEATDAIVQNAQNITMQNSAGAAIAGNHPASVVNGVLSNVKLAATIAPVANGAALVVPVTGSYTTTATVTVANGVVTAIVLS